MIYWFTSDSDCDSGARDSRALRAGRVTSRARTRTRHSASPRDRNGYKTPIKRSLKAERRERIKRGNVCGGAEKAVSQSDAGKSGIRPFFRGADAFDPRENISPFETDTQNELGPETDAKICGQTVNRFVFECMKTARDLLGSRRRHVTPDIHARYVIGRARWNDAHLRRKLGTDLTGVSV